MKTKGFTLIELVVVIIILAIMAVVAAPRFLSLSNDAKIAVLEDFKGRAQEVIRNVDTLVNIKGKTYISGEHTYLEYSAGIDLRLEKNGRLDIHDLCKGMGLLNVTLDGNDKTTLDGQHRCKYENSQKAFIQNNTLSQDQCFVLIKPSSYSVELTCLDPDQCLCP